jgi:hypothetical protein
VARREETPVLAQHDFLVRERAPLESSIEDGQVDRRRRVGFVQYQVRRHHEVADAVHPQRSTGVGVRFPSGEAAAGYMDTDAVSRPEEVARAADEDVVRRDFARGEQLRVGARSSVTGADDAIFDVETDPVRS